MDDLAKQTPYFSGRLGHAYLGNSLELLPQIGDHTVDIICTSPPFALLRKKAYGNVHADEYIDWFMQFAAQFHRVLKPTGSLIIDIGGTWVKGYPIRSLYHYELVLRLCKPVEDGGAGFCLAQELYWYNPAKLPTPAEWVTVRRVRVKDAVNTVWWLSPDPHPKAYNKRVLKKYSESQIKLMQNGYKPKLRPSEHDISDKFGKNNAGAIPPNIVDGVDEELHTIGDTVHVVQNADGEDIWQDSNSDAISEVPVNVISAANTASNDQYLRLCREHGINPHPARFPRALPEFAIGLCTEPGDLVLDPFGGSCMTGWVAEQMGRRWIMLEQHEEYLQGGQLRFVNEQVKSVAKEVGENHQMNLMEGME